MRYLILSTVASFNWIFAFRDWCISRQLWWGHRIPAYFVTVDDPSIPPGDSDNDDYWVSAHDEEEAISKAAAKFKVSKEKVTVKWGLFYLLCFLVFLYCWHILNSCWFSNKDIRFASTKEVVRPWTFRWGCSWHVVFIGNVALYYFRLARKNYRSWCFLPWFSSWDWARHPFLLGCPYGIYVAGVDWKVAFQRGLHEIFSWNIFLICVVISGYGL